MEHLSKETAQATLRFLQPLQSILLRITLKKPSLVLLVTPFQIVKALFALMRPGLQQRLTMTTRHGLALKLLAKKCTNPTVRL